MKLHLGCGSKHIEGWTHIDVLDYPHVDFRHSIDSLPMIADRSAELIYACHVLEHFHRRDVVRVLREWHRVLEPGGVLRVAVPDFRAIAEAYTREEADLDQLVGLIFGRQDYLYNVHYAVYDRRSLERVLEAAGFHSLRPYDWRRTEHANVDDYSQAYLPHLQRETGRLMSLNMEALA